MLPTPSQPAFPADDDLAGESDDDAMALAARVNERLRDSQRLQRPATPGTTALRRTTPIPG